MRVATWNINGLRARLDFVLYWLETRQPDLVGLQELKIADEQFPRDVFEKAGYCCAIFGQKSWNGVAVLSRKPVEVVQRGLPGKDEFGARFITVRLDELSFTNVYVPNGKTVDHEDYPRKLHWLESLAAYFAETHKAGQPAVLGGDFNLCPGPLDSWDEQRLAGTIFHTDAERSRYQRLLDWGFADLFRSLHPTEKRFTWWDYRGGAFHRGWGLRIDLLLATQPLLPKLQKVEIDRDFRKKQNGLTASDHAPVFADFD